MSWTTQNKVLPGVYTNFKASKPTALETGSRGTVALVGEFPWGASKTVLQVDDSNTMRLLGYKLGDTALQSVRLILQNATKVLLYRLNEGTKAVATLAEGLTATAVHGGTRGNDLAVVVKQLGAEYEVSTYLAGELVDVQIVGSAADIRPNGWFTVAGEGGLTEATAAFTGGTDGSSATEDLTAALDALKVEEFDVLVSANTAHKAALIAYVKQQRSEDEKLIQCVVVDEQADHEGVLSLRQSLIDTDGNELAPNLCACWLAGATAGAKITQSNTHKAVRGMVDVKPRYTRLMQENAVLSGQCVFDKVGDDVVLLYDINTLMTVGADKLSSYKKNKIVRVLDTTNRDIVKIIKTEFLGKVANNADGRGLIKGRIAEYLSSVQAMGAIENFSATDDVAVQQGAEVDAVVVNYAVQPVDTGDKFYLTAEVR